MGYDGYDPENEHWESGSEDFNHAVRRAQENSDGSKPDNAWERLVAGKTIGKSTTLVTSAAAQNLPATNLFTVGGDDRDALQLQVTVVPPQVFLNDPAGNPFPIPANRQDASGSVTSNDNFLAPFLRQVNMARAVLQLDWAVGGVESRAFVDVIQGCAINISASWVRAGMFIEAQTPPAAQTPGLMKVGAYVGPGTPRPRNAQRSLFGQGVAAGTEQGPFVVPPFAKTLHVLGAPVGGGAAGLFTGYVNYFNFPATVAGGGIPFASFFVNGNQPTPFPVPAQAYYFSVVPELANAQWVAVFDLNI